MIRTKIVATLGPATSSPEILRRLFDAGLDVCRLNFSHGDFPDHERMLANLRAAASEYGQPIAILGDLCGPKIRLGKIAEHQGAGGMPIARGDTLIIQRQPIVGAAGRVSTIYPRFVDDVRVGDSVFVEDGLLRFVVRSKTPDEVVCECLIGGVLKSNKGINLPQTPVSAPAIAERDWQFVQWAIDHDLDYLALSFVRSADEVLQLRKHIDARSSGIRIISKIEKPQAVRDIQPILDASDGLMVARGDLGVEMDVAEVPVIQKDLVRRCQEAGKPVIVATQMLQSMIDNPTPTRAEVSDVANAIFDGADAIMLSGETSVGQYPVRAVEMMNHVAEITEAYIDTQLPIHPCALARSAQLSSAIAHGVWEIIQHAPAKLVVLWSQTGTTAAIFSKCRFPMPLLAMSDDTRALRRMALLYGVIPQSMAPAESMDDLVARVDRVVVEHQLAANGDRVVLVAGSSSQSPGNMNGIVVHTVGQKWTPVTLWSGA